MGALDMLIDLLDDSDAFVRHLELSRLNEFEFEGKLIIRSADLPRQSGDYQTRRSDGRFREMMVDHLAKRVERYFDDA